MPYFHLTVLAKQDLRSIGRYTQQTWGREQRNIYLSKLDDSFHLLAQEPTLGRACDDIRDGYRKYHIGRHLIFGVAESRYEFASRKGAKPQKERVLKCSIFHFILQFSNA